MPNSTSHQTGLITALLTFGIATFLLLGYAFNGNSGYLFVGLLFTFFAIIANLIVLVYIIMRNKHTSNTRLPQDALYLLFNIPVFLVYLWITAFLTEYHDFTIFEDCL
jgi:hypothetical protein